MKHDTKNRRMFLQNSLGLGLTIPFLSSIFKGSELLAIESETTHRPRFVFLGFDHNISLNAVVPDLSVGNWGRGNANFLNTEQNYRKGNLPSDIGLAGSAFDIPLLANSTLKSKFNVYNGLLLAAEGGSGHLQAGGKTNSFPLTASMTSEKSGGSIDTILAESFYKDKDPILRHMLLGGGYKFSADRQGNLLVPEIRPDVAFDKYFAGGSLFPFEPGEELSAEQITAIRKKRYAQSIIDAFKEDLDKVRSNKRLSQSDRKKMDHYLSHVRDFEVKYLDSSTLHTQCRAIEKPAGNSRQEMLRREDAYFTLAIAALQCDLTRVISISGLRTSLGFDVLAQQGPLMKAELSGSRDDTHGYWHYCSSAAASVPVHQNLIGSVAKFANKLDAVVDPYTNESLLDSTLVLSTHENAAGNEKIGNASHQLSDFSYYSFGGSNFINTGLMFDGLDGNRKTIGSSSYSINSFLITMMKSLGLSSKDWQKNDESGFGDYASNINRRRYDGENLSSNIELANKNAAIPGIIKG